MIRTRSTLLLAALIVVVGVGTVPPGAVAAGDCAFPYSSTDATGTNVTVAAEPSEVVTLNPSAAQTMWEIGAEEKVTGLSGFALYLDGADNRTNVYPVTSTSVDVEAVVNLTPDLVLAPNTIPNATVSQLRTAGLTVYKFDTATDVAFIVEKTRLTGRLVGECDGANDRADQLEEEVATIREATDGVDRPRVFYTFFGFTAGEDTFIDTIITTAGGENVAAEAGISGYKDYSEEIVVANDPEWILLNSDQPSVPDTDAFNGTTAVAEGNNVTVDANYVSQPAPRIVEPMLKIVKALHPEAYEEAKQGVEQVSGDGDPELPPPSFSITSSSLSADRVELRDTVTVNVTIENDGGPGTFEAGLYLDGSLRTVEYLDLDAGESATLRIDHSFGAWGDYGVRVNDHRVGNVTVVRGDLEESESGDSDGEANETGDSAEPPRTTTETAEETTERTATATATASATPTETIETPTRTATTSPTRTATTEHSPTSTERSPTGTDRVGAGGQPGFGVPAAVAAMLVALLVRRRR